jgi:hypothetical protein
LTVQGRAGHQHLQFVFEFHISTIRFIPDVGNRGISDLQKFPAHEASSRDATFASVATVDHGPTSTGRSLVDDGE